MRIQGFSFDTPPIGGSAIEAGGRGQRSEPDAL